MKSFRSFQLDRWCARALRLVVALCASLIAACGGGYGGGSSGMGGMGGMSSSTPTITTQPTSQSVHVGQTATFTVVATGPSGYTNFTYQWMSQPPGMSGFTAISSATGPSYTTPAAMMSDSGTNFKVQVSNSYGPTPSNAAMLTVMP
jgi:hypothetical protein